MPYKPTSGYFYSGSPASMKRRIKDYKPKTIIKPRETPAAYTPPLPGPDPYGALSTGEIDKRATALANAGLTPQQEEIRRQQGVAQRAATADEQAITGFQTAAGTLLAGISPQISSAYSTASKDVGSFGAAVGGDVGRDITAAQAADQAFAASQGQSGGSTVNAEGAGAAVSMLGGVIPGQALATEGASRAAEAAANVAIPLNAGREELAARMAKATQDNDQYAQQLIQLAAQFPGLKAQALQQLNQYEIDKANYRRGLAQDIETKRVDAENIRQGRVSAAETHRVNTENIAASRATTIRENRAELANEKAAGLDAAVAAGKAAAAADLSKYRWATLQFKNKQALAAAKAAAAKGKRIDVQASRLLGHIVYQDGTEDTSIEVEQTTGTKDDPSVKARVNRARAVQAARQGAFSYATTLRGKPQLNKQAGTPLGGKGKYIAGPNEKYGVPGGVFPPAYKGAPATTNNPNRAARLNAGATDYADAQTKVWAQIGGDSLMSRYGYSREQVMSIVNRALAAAGWKRR